jgi:hypothetical protein
MAAAAQVTNAPWDNWRVTRVARMQEDLHRLLEFTVARTDLKETDADAVTRIVDEACSIARIPPATMTYDEELRLWKSWREVHGLSQPASAAGLRLLWALLWPGQERKRLATLATRLRRWAGVYLFVMLVLIAVVHSWAGLGDKIALATDNDLQGYSGLMAQKSQREDLDLKEARALQVAKGTRALKLPASTGAVAAPPPLEILLPDQIASRGALLQPALQRHLARVGAWNFAWQPNQWLGALSIYAGIRDKARRAPTTWIQDGGRLIEEVRDARTALYMITSYLLPMLYGALGALVWALRSMIVELEVGAIGFLTTLRMRTRLILGMVFGFSASTLMPDGYFSIPREGALAFCFLAGYGVDVAFSLLDHLISSFGEWAKASPARRA